MPRKSKTTKARPSAKSPKRRKATVARAGTYAMAHLTASDTRIPPRTFNQVAYKGERVSVGRRGGDVIFLVSREDVELLRRLEDKADLAIVRKRRGEKTIPLEQVKRELGL